MASSSSNSSISLRCNHPGIEEEEYFQLDTLSPNDTPWSTPKPRISNASLNDGDFGITTLLEEPHILRSDQDRSDTVQTSSREDSPEPDGVPRVTEFTTLRRQLGPRSEFESSMRRNNFHLRDWKWEFAAAAFSFGCSASIVGVLFAFWDKSLLSWQFMFNITLNTLLAILSTLSRTALLVPIASCISQLKWIHFVGSPHKLRELQLFDDASRGPWGSWTLIRGLHFNAKLATWGSFITINSLAMGPFTQQLLSYPSRLHDSSGAYLWASVKYGSDRGPTLRMPFPSIE